MAITFDKINRAIAKAQNISTVPDPTLFSKYHDNEVIDEDKSVRWNREEVAKRNEAYNAEKTRLMQECDKAWSDVTELYIKYIAQETNMTEAKARIVYSYLYARYHHSSLSTMHDEIEDFIDMVNNLQKID